MSISSETQDDDNDNDNNNNNNNNKSKMKMIMIMKVILYLLIIIFAFFMGFRHFISSSSSTSTSFNSDSDSDYYNEYVYNDNVNNNVNNLVNNHNNNKSQHHHNNHNHHNIPSIHDITDGISNIFHREKKLLPAKRYYEDPQFYMNLHNEAIQLSKDVIYDVDKNMKFIEKTKKNISLYKGKCPNTYTEKQSKFDCFKATKILKGKGMTMEQLTHLVFYEKNIPLYDDLYQRGENITKRDWHHGASRIRHTYYKAIFPASKRDFSILMGFVKLKDHSLLAYVKSFIHPLMPEVKGYVRVNVIRSAYHLKDLGGSGLEDKGVEFTLIMQSELGGSVPSWLVNHLGLKKTAGVIEAIEKNGKNYPSGKDINNTLHRLIPYEKDFEQIFINALGYDHHHKHYLEYELLPTTTTTTTTTSNNNNNNKNLKNEEIIMKDK